MVVLANASTLYCNDESELSWLKTGLELNLAQEVVLNCLGLG